MMHIKHPIAVKKFDKRATMPSYATTEAAGADLHAVTDEDIVIRSGDTVMVHTGIGMELPDGWVGLIFARSGLASKKGLAPANKVGVIDADYRGEFLVALHNHSDSSQTISNGERIAQLVIVPYLTAEFQEVDELDETKRGDKGFGSTGLF